MGEGLSGTGQEARTDFRPVIREALGLPEVKDPALLSPLNLAYLGDNIYELVNRSIAVSAGSRSVQKLHRECLARANAGTQAKIAGLLYDDFTEEEAAVFRRGRNAEVHTKAKNATYAEYHDATGLEAVVGYLYLLGRYERITELLKRGFEAFGLL